MSEDTQATGTQVAPDTTADTATTQASEASAQTTNEAPEATQGQAEAQEADVTEVRAEDTVEDKLYAGKYKTVEELEKAYKNAESKLGQTSSERAELARTLNETFVENDYQDGGSAETERLKRDTAVLKFMMSRPDTDANTMKEVLETDPYIGQIQGYEARLEYAYLRSQNMSHQKAIAEAEKKGATQAQVKAAEKQVAQVESAKKAEPVDEDSELMVKATQGSPDERDAARMALIRKHLVNL